jgi:hypothetical protein
MRKRPGLFFILKQSGNHALKLMVRLCCMKHLTHKEARRLVYKLSIKVWLIFVIIFSLTSAVLYFNFPTFAPLDSYEFLVPFISVLLYPIALIESYKKWMRDDAKLIWGSEDKINEIYRGYRQISDNFYAHNYKYIEIYRDGRYIPSRAVIFKEYVVERNKAVDAM